MLHGSRRKQSLLRKSWLLTGRLNAASQQKDRMNKAVGHHALKLQESEADVDFSRDSGLTFVSSLSLASASLSASSAVAASKSAAGVVAAVGRSLEGVGREKGEGGACGVRRKVGASVSFTLCHLLHLRMSVSLHQAMQIRVCARVTVGRSEERG